MVRVVLRRCCAGAVLVSCRVVLCCAVLRHLPFANRSAWVRRRSLSCLRQFAAPELSVSEAVGMVPLIPRTSLAARVPFVCVAPVLTEIDAGTFSGLVPAVPGDRCSDPFPASAGVGVKRYFELPLRPDVSTQTVLNAFASAGASLALDGVHSSASAVLLQQKVRVCRLLRRPDSRPAGCAALVTPLPRVAGP